MQKRQLRTSDFDFDLPSTFIANDPVEPRDHCKLLVYDSSKGAIFHRRFDDIGEFFTSGDALVMNKSKVVKARLVLDGERSGQEIFFLKSLGDSVMKALVRPGKKFKVGASGSFGGFSFDVIAVDDDGARVIEWSGNVFDVLDSCGVTPLPPYIKNSKSSDEDYQTIYAKDSGSVAAPTAGLHFTKRLLESLKEQGVHEHEVLLHVGRGTFLPVSADLLSDHEMHSEEYEIDADTAGSLNDVKGCGGSICAVGTTSVRVLESNYDGAFRADRGETDIFIYPGKYQWKCVDRLITNFHLPKSTLLMLVASFLESKGVDDCVEEVLRIYEEAKDYNYRFYSFGDAMLII